MSKHELGNVLIDNRIIPDARDLGAALLWLRNRYDVGRKLEPFEHLVIEAIDTLLRKPGSRQTWVSVADLKAFRDKYLTTPLKT